jgi:hypothetical protein
MALTIINELLQQRNILDMKYSRMFDAQMEMKNIYIGWYYTQLYIKPMNLVPFSILCC